MELKKNWLETVNLNITNKGDIKKELDWIMKKLESNLNKFGEAYPAPATKDGIYPIIENREWTTSFWTGMLWIAYEYTKNEKFKNAAIVNTESFINRLNTRYEIDHHDIGFLYSLSTVAAYKVTGEEKYKEASLKAADLLLERYIPEAEIIQAWGPKFGENENRAIIDSLLNLPLLYWASENASDSKYLDIATKHYNKVVGNIIRDDNTTYHTYYFDFKDGTPLYGKTRQGYSDDSCWTRGQAWSIYGQVLGQKNIKDVNVDRLDDVLNYFVNNLPNDAIAYWDLIFDDSKPSDRDTSSNAIVLCGLLQMISDNKDKDGKLEMLVKVMLTNLQKNYTSKDSSHEGILLHGVYSWHSGRGVDEANIWGDYYYLEALYRIYNNRWKTYW